VSQAKRAGQTPDVWEVLFTYKLYTVGDRTDGTLRHPCLHFSWRRHFASYRNSELSLREKRANNLIKQVENSNLDNLYGKRAFTIKGFIYIQDFHSRRYIIVDIKDRVVRKGEVVPVLN
jgi:hypothetical protein